MNIEFSVTENIHRTKDGRIVEIDYRFEESSYISTSSTETTVTTQSKERRTVFYDVIINRKKYENLVKTLKNRLQFEIFIEIVRPLILGFYEDDQLRRAFSILDQDGSGTIHIDELASFLPLLNDAINSEALQNYVRQVDENFDGFLNFGEFRSLVLRGIGRDIICKKI